jgi:hypothetical protein
MENTTQNTDNPVENTATKGNGLGCFGSILSILLVIILLGLVVWFFRGDAIIAIKHNAPWWSVVLAILSPIIVIAIIAKK